MNNHKWLIVFILFIIISIGVWLKFLNISVVKNFDNTENIENINKDIQDSVIVDPQLIINGQTFFVELAKDLAVQKKGLSGRDSLGANQAMLFDYPDKKILSFWMIDMRFNIDLLWINDDKIVGLEKNMLKPALGTEDKDLLIYSSSEAVNRVLEINSGLIDRYNIKIGDTIEYKNINF